MTPFSSLHEDESHQWRGYKDFDKEKLMAFIKSFSRGKNFKSAEQIQHAQIFNGFQSFLKNENEVPELKNSAIQNGNRNEWDDYFRIDMNNYYGDVEQIRKYKALAINALVDVFSGWRASPSSYSEIVELELLATFKGYLDSYTDMIVKFQQDSVDAFLNAPTSSDVIAGLLRMQGDEKPIKERLAVIGNYSRSPQYRNLPFILISCHLFATLRLSVQQGKYANKKKAEPKLAGFFYDINHVATYAPYCDAMYVDREIHKLIRSSKFNIEEQYEMQVFSPKNFDKLENWLDEITDNIPKSHTDALARVYPNIGD